MLLTTSATGTTTAATPPVPATRIFIVDDHQILRDGLRLRLERERDFEVVGEASTAAAAYAGIGATRPDLVLMDVNLPDESGVIATGRIRAAWPRTRILALSGADVGTSVHDLLLAGASGFLHKADASSELVHAIRVVAAGKMHLSAEGAVALAATLRVQPVPTPETQLSEREIDVLKRLSEGLGYKQIADDLGVSVKSVETYRARLVRKTGCVTRAELVRFAVRKGLVAA